jgi:tetratricopeptide (TPR) repeat protein
VQDRPWSALVRREVIALAVLVALAAAVFGLTHAAAAAHRRLRLRDAEAWYSKGTTRLASGDAVGAAEALRRATAIARNNQTYQLALATALSAADADAAARRVLLQLRDRAPESAEVNVRLARLEASRGDVTAAMRYYQSAVHGIWPTESPEPRRAVRIELIQYMLEHDQKGRALAELLVLEDNLPPKADDHLRAARLFLEADDARRALSHFEIALKLTPRSTDALVGAAQAAFAIGDYVRARRYLHTTGDPRVEELRAIVDFISTRDPLAPRISGAERRRRLLLDMDDVSSRLSECSSAEAEPLLADIKAFMPRAKARRQEEGTIEDGVALINRVEEQLPTSCGALRPLDRALLIIGRRHGGSAS